MNEKEYSKTCDIITTDAEILLFHALMEISEHIGNNMHNPLSLNLLCLLFNINHDIQGKILCDFNQILERTPFEKLELSIFKNIIIKHHKDADAFTDLTFKAFIKAYSKYLPKLYPFIKELE